MMLLNTSLLRERFIITEENSKQDPIIAMGNRILLPLVSKNQQIKERLIIRAHSMHIALALAAAITKEFHASGPIVNRQKPFAWKELWYDITNDFERPHTPETWCCIYNNGRPVFQDGDHHPFLDIIEQCDIKNRAEYDRAIPLAEEIFSKAGKTVKIDHDVNIAVVIGAMENQLRCGLILRAPRRTTTFNFMVEEKSEEDSHPLHPYHGLELASHFLEAIQLSVISGFIERQIKNGDLVESDKKAVKASASYRRIGRLSQSIETYEKLYKMRYRPEKPEFKHLLDEARGGKIATPI